MIPTLANRKRPSVRRRFRSRFESIEMRLRPGAAVKTGASIGLVMLVLLLAAFYGIDTGPGLPGILDEITGIVWHIGKIARYGLLVAVILTGISLLKSYLRWYGLVALILFLFFAWDFGFPLDAAIVTLALVPLAQAVLGGAVAFLFTGTFRNAPPVKKTVVIAALLGAIALEAFLVSWLANSGDDHHLVTFDPPNSHGRFHDPPPPSEQGSFHVLTLAYGSGENRRRPEFGEMAHLKTDPVDATPFLDGPAGWKSHVRRRFWGFDASRLPVNGTVWYPDGPGPYPLVLMVHGDHRMEEFSDPGYAYLGGFLASRGLIFVSVDANYLNGSYFSGGFRAENDCRGWLLLRHLSVWREWNETVTNPFFQKVDMGRIGLIGHSRGGEAVAIAAAFNKLHHYPDDANVMFDFEFGIKSIIAIAPSDGQYRPAGQPVRLENINYLLLQGAHDADAHIFLGSRQYQRIRFTDGNYWFKALAYSYRSNHGQFNTVWGAHDAGWPKRLILNRRAYLEGEEQRDIARTYIGSFLDATLRHRAHYIPFLRDHRSASEWLPDDIYITRFEDSSFKTLAGYEEDIDLTTGSLPEVRTDGNGLLIWKERQLRFRNGSERQNQAVYLGWRQSLSNNFEAGAPEYSIEWDARADDLLKVNETSLLVFSLARSDEALPPSQAGRVTSPRDGAATVSPRLDISIELLSRSGQSVRRPLSHFRAIPPALRTRYTKLSEDTGYFGQDYEPVLQTFELSLADFTGSSRFDLNRLRAVKFVFDRCEEGYIILDDIGFARSGNERGGNCE